MSHQYVGQARKKKKKLSSNQQVSENISRQTKAINLSLLNSTAVLK